MRFMIVGVGQTFNLETREMEDILQVEAPDGSIISVPTTNGAAQSLVKMAMNGDAPPPVRPRAGDTILETPSGHTAFAGPGIVPGSVTIQGEQAHKIGEVDDFPAGADIFGSDAPEMMVDEPDSLGDLEDAHKVFAKTKRTMKSASLGRTTNNPDRSGVPSYGIARVDRAGNPILSPTPDLMMEDEEDEEDDPGEQA